MIDDDGEVHTIFGIEDGRFFNVIMWYTVLYFAHQKYYAQGDFKHGDMWYAMGNMYGSILWFQSLFLFRKISSQVDKYVGK